MSKDSNVSKEFRSALGQFPTGVTIISARSPEGKPVAVTASSFNSVSIEPPLILWSVDRVASNASVFEKAEYFAVNVLANDQAELSNHFASRQEDKFADKTFDSGLGDAPLLGDCAAQFQCKTWALYDGGDHTIIVGEVLEFSRDESKSPLIFGQGKYAELKPL